MDCLQKWWMAIGRRCGSFLAYLAGWSLYILLDCTLASPCAGGGGGGELVPWLSILMEAGFATDEDLNEQTDRFYTKFHKLFRFWGFFLSRIIRHRQLSMPGLWRMAGWVLSALCHWESFRILTEQTNIHSRSRIRLPLRR